MFLSPIMFLATLLHGSYCLAASTTITTTTLLQQTPTPAHPHECDSIDVRNECSNLLQLSNCTVVKGFVLIVLLPKANNNNTTEICDYKKYRFPLLREITDFLIFYNVKGLRSTSDLFPNLTVIRGRRLFLNYALGITNMPDLEMVEFRSLVAIQRGHVMIGSCPKLCFLEKINFDRLTLSVGENHIYPMTPELCPTKSECKSCDNEYCWSNRTCQYFENDNVLNYYQGIKNCHKECLGGCYLGNTTNRGCNVCRQMTDHGACEEECASNNFVLDKFQRCLNEDECSELGMQAHDKQCVPKCSNDFIPDDTQTQNYDCVPCQPQSPNEPITIFNLADADHISGCKILNGSLVISIRNQINENDLLKSLSNIIEIRGHLKIYRSPFLTSLQFLKGLRKISGDPLENGLYALIVYDNKNLRELWEPENFELMRGSMYVQLNNKLCNHKMYDFRDKVVHDRTHDSLHISDHDVLCGPAKLSLEIVILSHQSFKLNWRKDQTSEEIEIIYRPIKHDEKLLEQSEEDANICTRINWHRKLLFSSELTHNDTHYSYVIEELEPFTKYACLLKTFAHTDAKGEARSELQYVITKMGIPTMPAITITKKTDTSLSLQIRTQNRTFEQIDHYLLELYELSDDVALLDKRNYCNQPFSLNSALGSHSDEDYEDCCARLHEETLDQHFLHNMRDQYSCSLNRKDNCALGATDKDDTHKPLLSKRLENNTAIYTLYHLERFRLHVLQLKACNEAGCSSYAMHSERTNYSLAADKLDDLHACHTPGSHEYRVSFSEPKHPNGVIISYVIHYRVRVPTDDQAFYQSHVKCVTRLQHVQANYQHVAQLNTTSFDEIVVLVHSLASVILTNRVNVSTCPTTKIAGIGGGDGEHAHGLNIFLIFFLIGAGGTLLWVCYKRRCWRKLHDVRRYLPLQRNWRALVIRSDNSTLEDRQILVDGFETVRFHNDPDDEHKYLE